MLQNNSPKFEDFLCNQDDIGERLDALRPKVYDRTRNYLDGAVSWLSPFITHGIISTADVATAVLEKHKAKDCYRFLYEIAWREYFHRTWQLHGDAIFDDMLKPQADVEDQDVPASILEYRSGITALDSAIKQLYSSGLMHNHARMWVAGTICNTGHRAWLPAARWFHYHLLDGDLASNTLSWQWIAGTFSHKRYIANQENINKYSKSSQQGSFLDISYEALNSLDTPPALLESGIPKYTEQPADTKIEVPFETIALRSIWNLDPTWQSDIDKHILFVETDWLKRWPLSDLRWTFIKHWATQCNAELIIGNVTELTNALNHATVLKREYPITSHWPGETEQRDWLYPLPTVQFSSFSQFWKQVKHTVSL